MRAQFTVKTLVNFNGNNGATPAAPLLQASDGNFYGTTESGGSGTSRGTVFRLTPGGALTTIFQFSSPYSNGADPQAGLVQTSAGDLLGCTAAGGTQGQGTLFKVTTAGAATPLYSFLGTFDGGQPHSALVRGSDNNFYGSTPAGGFYFSGTVFQLTTNGSFNSVYSFSGPDGANPYGSLVSGLDGNLYGTAQYGGPGYNGSDFSGQGTLFQLSLNGSLNTWVYFNGNNGAVPLAGLVRGVDGNFYGTTSAGGTNGNNGTVFRLNTNGVFTTLWSFNGTNGASPAGNLVQETDGTFYGTTSAGGIGYDGSTGSGYGTIFQITTNGHLATLFLFNGASGSNPQAGLCAGTNGTFYGTTSAGGTADLGTVFQLSFPPEFKSIGRSTASVQLIWSAIAGHYYQLQYRTNLTQGAWLPLGTPLAATNSVATASDSLQNDHERFYRVRLAY